MQIAICDNDSVFRGKLHSYIVEFKRNKRIHVDIYEFENGKDLLSSELSFDLIFLAYLLPDINGMKIARELRSKDTPSTVIFVTEYTEFVFEAFEVRPYRFFTKPVNKEIIIKTLSDFFSEQKSTAPITIMENGIQKTIASRDIIYLEGSGKYCIIRTKNDTLRSSKTLSEVLSYLPNYCFFRIHRSYAVNLYYISSINNRTVTFINGEKALISRACIEDFNKVYSEFKDRFYVRL